MCTVIFIPGNDKYCFASLRDESPLRTVALHPIIRSIKKLKYLAPTDPKGNGTWIGVNNLGNVIVLLNGAFHKHVRKESYKISRGLIVDVLLSSEMPILDWSLINLNDVEPFTLIVWDNNNLFQLVWDGQHRFKNHIDEKLAHIWSSSTLYNATAKANREIHFQKWIDLKKVVSMDSLLSFFKSFPDIENGFIINRNEHVKTLSYTFIELTKHVKAELNYFDMDQLKCTKSTINLI